MKTSLFATLSFLLLLFTTKPLLARSANRALIDTDGSEVESNRHYHVVSAIWGAGGGGLSLHSGRNSQCPLDVIQEHSDMQRGMRMRFSPFDNSNTVRESTDLNVKFIAQISSCNEEPVWKVDDYDDSRGRWFITTGGQEGNPGAKTLRNWFKLERIGSIAGMYKIVHCPSVCDSCMKLCNNVGISYENGVRRLALVSDDERALAVVLIPAKERSSSV